MIDNQLVTGRLSYTLVDEAGNVKEEFEGPNLVVSVGLQFLASLLAGGAPTLMSHMAVGSSATAPAPANTTLGSELGRVAFTSTSASLNNVLYSATFPPGTGTGTIAEAGLFNNSVGGTMLSRSTAISVIKAAGDTLNVVWTITFNS